MLKSLTGRLLAGIAVTFMTSINPASARPSGTPEQELAEYSALLGDDIYHRHADEGTNLVFSPLSIHTALLMTSAGAAGDTLAGMQKTLGLNFRYLRDPHATMGPVLASLRHVGKPAADPAAAYQLTISNNLWLQQGYPVKPAFTAILKRDYQAEIASLNFQKEPDAARQTINDAVAKQTNDKIKDLLPPGTIDPLTHLVLTNAVYFKSDWLSTFYAGATKDAPFHTLDGKTANVPTMNQRHTFGYFEDQSLKMLELPYQGRQLSMLVILPIGASPNTNLESLGKALDQLPTWIDGLKPRAVTVALPRFKFSSTLNLASDLPDMKDAFTDKADFSGITSHEKLHISAIVHQAMIAVDENGTEAAAATGMAVGAAAARKEPEPAEFIADHPFLFAIRHNATGAILFLGRVATP